ncbi:MAG: AraC family transcriptional regulator, partial [Pseudomonadota bacterium]
VVLHGEFINLFEGLQKEVGREDVMGRKARACRLHAALLGLWLARQDNHLVSGLGSASEALARRYTTLVERDYAKAPSIAELADELGVTPTHLSRACRAALGYTAHDILSERVMFEARSQLAGSARPVNAIAADLGFSSPAYFTRAFQKFTGNTPSAFREAHRIA